jgi:HK97 family phage major capsid protein
MSIESQVEALEAASDVMFEEAQGIESAWGTDRSKMPAGQAERHERLMKGVQAKIREVADLTDATNARAAKIDAIRAAAQDPRNREGGFGGAPAESFASTGRNRANPWNDLGESITRSDSPDGLRARALDAIEAIIGVPSEGRERMARLVDNLDERNAAELVLAGSDPHYRTGFEKYLRNPTHGHMLWTAQEQAAYARTEGARAALSLTTGSVLVPFTLDPTIVLTNAGAANPFRGICRMETTATNSWNGVSSAGVTANWLAEGAVVGDNTPSFGPITIVPQKAAAWVFGSVEVIGDTNFATQLPQLLGDAKALLENTAFSVGTGTGQPKGIVTAATTSVATAVAATFSIADVYALQQALPPRSRLGKTPAVVANVAIINKIRQMDTAGGSSYFTNLGQGAPPEVLALRLAEASGMSASTASAQKIAVAGDFDKFAIVDRLGMTVQFEDIVKDAATGRPTGQSGWFMYFRTGGDVLDASVFRVLTVA